MKRFQTLIFIGSLFIIITSCNKEVDTRDPLIVFITPASGTVILLPDTIDIVVNITDDHILKQVSMGLVDENHAPVNQSKYFYPNASSYTLESTMTIVDKAILTGQYYLHITATDGTNVKNNYLGLTLHEVPEELLGFIAVTSPLSFKSKIIKMDPSFETDTQFVLNKTFLMSGSIGLWDQFFFVSDVPSALTSFDATTFKPQWSFAFSPPRPLITGLFSDKDLVISSANGDAVEFVSDGTVKISTQPYEDKKIQFLTADENYIYAAHISLNGNIQELTTFYRKTGGIKQQKILTGNISCLVPGKGKLLVFLTGDAGTTVLEYDPEYMTTTGLITLTGEKVVTAEKISDNEVFLVTENKVISYSISNNHFTDFKDEVFDFCRYEKMTDIIFLARDREIYGYDRTNGALRTHQMFDDKIVDFQIIYNR